MWVSGLKQNFPLHVCTYVTLFVHCTYCWQSYGWTCGISLSWTVQKFPAKQIISVEALSCENPGHTAQWLQFQATRLEIVGLSTVIARWNFSLSFSLSHHLPLPLYLSLSNSLALSLCLSLLSLPLSLSCLSFPISPSLSLFLDIFYYVADQHIVRHIVPDMSPKVQICRRFDKSHIKHNWNYVRVDHAQ